MNKLLIITTISLFLTYFFSLPKAVGQDYDMVIYGGTSAGVAAAIQASRMNKSVLLIEPSHRLGGLTTGGLGQTDIGNKQAIGGIAREFYQNIRKYYENPENWKWQTRQEYRDSGQTRTAEGEDAMWTFEPSAALEVYHQMIQEENIEIVYDERLDRTSNGVSKSGQKINSITMESGKIYSGKIFMDATYEGDLMATANVSYTVGRESNDEYGETLNGVQANYWSVSLKGNPSRNAANHNFVPGVDPYIEKGNPGSGLLPYIIEVGPGIDGTGDKKIQAYGFRMCLTDHPENRIPFAKPENYNEQNFELLFRNYEVGEIRVPWINSAMPNRKTDTNNNHGFSTDFTGQNHYYPEASYEEREKIIEAHRQYQKGLMWSLAYHPRVPEKIRNVVSKWGTCKDEFEREDGWQNQLYIREARRMVSDYVMSQHHCEGLVVAEDVVGLAAYGMDSHNIQRYVDHNGYVQNEGNVQSAVVGPYPISYRSIIPKKGEAENLLVPVCLSATHIGFGSIRMEPVFMVLGQSAAIAAAIAIDTNSSLQDLDYENLKTELINYKQRLE
ncbi:FAD-dependent oxidoreductase [Algoriphagus aquimarinus]|uniref:FAD-dependent oxidoreductase n=1 Tax=Algoriphagus aquimarinus TaxID=237018 RepID=UPI0030DD14A1